MIKIKFVFTIALFSLLLYACSGSGSTEEDFDHEAQALIDQDTLTKFLSNFYYDIDIDSIKPLVAGKTALIDDPELKEQTVTENDIQYKLYYYVTEVGVGTPFINPITGDEERKSFPTVMDSVLTQYKGYSIEKIDSIRNFETSYNPIWLKLNSSFRGMSYGIPHFKGGKNITNNGPITYKEGGRGIIIMPSGLGKGNDITSPLRNRCLYFYINLYDLVEDTDHDNDGVPSIYEDPDGNGDPRDDDSDSDGIANYFDLNDDNDGILTKDEDVNGDGDPRNDDTDGDGTPNYLDNDDDGDGILSINEDTNSDGDYTNDDTDGDGIPNYLDKDN